MYHHFLYAFIEYEQYIFTYIFLIQIKISIFIIIKYIYIIIEDYCYFMITFSKKNSQVKIIIYFFKSIQY